MPIIKNVDLGKTQITPLIRVSSAAIFYEESEIHPYFQYETFIFSSDPRQETKQIVHGTNPYGWSKKLEAKTVKIHNYISENLKKTHS